MNTIVPYTSLRSKGCLGGRNDGISKQDMCGTLDFGKQWRQMILFGFSWSHPGCEMSHLSVISIIGKETFRPLSTTMLVGGSYECLMSIDGSKTSESVGDYAQSGGSCHRDLAN